MKKTITLYVSCILALVAGLFLVAGCGESEKAHAKSPEPAKADKANVTAIAPDSKPRVLFVNSYHKEYFWSAELLGGMLKVFKGKFENSDIVDDPRSLVCLRICHMDTKRHSSEADKLNSAVKVKTIIDEWQPDLVIFAEDNAAKYLVSKYYRTSDIPFVFCGINWDASEYGFLRKNVTGMLEVDLIVQTLSVLKKYAKGDRIGVLGEDNESNRKSTFNYISKFGLEFEKVIYVKNLEEWKAAYLDLQKTVDMLIVEPPCFLLSKASDAERADAKKFVYENTAIPSGCVENWIADYALICMSKSASEHGEWAASAALEILNGRSPADIPIVENERVILYLNMLLANKLGYVFPMEIVEQACIVE